VFFLVISISFRWLQISYFVEGVGDGANMREFSRFEIADGSGAARPVRAGERSVI
jgi:hypothetical protein